jgi:hypothetical protein
MFACEVGSMRLPSVLWKHSYRHEIFIYLCALLIRYMQVKQDRKKANPASVNAGRPFLFLAVCLDITTKCSMFESSFQTNTIMQNIIVEKLRIGTVDLKDEYFKLMGEYADRTFKIADTRAGWPKDEWHKLFGIEFRSVTRWGKALLEPVNGALYRDMCKTRHEAMAISGQGFEKYKDKIMKHAEKHYEQSLEKLAYRIAEKTLDFEHMTVKTGTVGVNIETTITDGITTVRAFTIIAQGPINRPHYRYLIK